MTNPLQAFLWTSKLIGAFNFLVILALLAFQCPFAPCPYAVRMEGDSTDDELLVFLSDDQCQRVIRDNHRQTLDIMYDCLGLGKSSGLSAWHFLIFGTCLGQ